MFKALNTAATGMTAQTLQNEVLANNIANADTTAFKRSRAEFQDLLYQNEKDPGSATSTSTVNPTGVQVGLGVKAVGTSREHEVGAARPTGRELDVFIGGDGFFSIQKPNGEVAYTRDGSFRLDPEGKLVNAQGYPVVPEITVPQGVRNVTIAADGTVSVALSSNEVQQLGQIQLTNFINSSGLQADGGNLYLQTPASGEAVTGNPSDQGFGRLEQRFLESSNVNSVSEMTDLIRSQRLFEMNSKVIQTTDQMLSTLNQMK
jgi:flagellar basal-body rod protein FlgG